MKDLRIVIPAYNEEEGIGDVIDRVVQACPGAEVVVVDDCSRDRTAEIARQKGVSVISKPTNSGYGRAIKTGFEYDSNGGISYLGFIDADNTYPPESFPELYKLCKEENIGVVVASRLSGENTGMPWTRKLGNKIFATLVSFYSRKRTTDATTGMRVFDIRLLPMVESLPDGLDFAFAITTIAQFTGLSYAEIPIEYYERSGQSKLSVVKDGYRFLNVVMNAARQYKPLLFFCTLGIPFLLVRLFVRAACALRGRDG